MRLAIAFVLATVGVASAQPVITFSSDPYDGIHRETWKDASVPVTMRVIRIDLTSAQIELLATEPGQAGQTTSAYVMHEGAQIGIDGDMFDPSGYRPEGLAMGGMMSWPATADDMASATFHFARVGAHTQAGIEVPEQVDTPLTLPTGTLGVVSGRPLLVSSGVPISLFDCTDPITIPCDQAPRAAVGLSENGHTLYLVVVDGWSAASYGLTDGQLAQFMASPAVGAFNALALNGGGAATLVQDAEVISTLSDGVERTVANHLAVKFGALPGLELIGRICESNLNDCSPTDNEIEGATVTLDDGSQQTSSSTGVYDFHDVVPRYACVTASKLGYQTHTRCVFVDANDQPTYDSIALQLCPVGGCIDLPDAGVADAGALGSPDAPTPPDGSRDAGNGLSSPPPGGCCQTGSDRPPIALAVVVAWFLARRRGTKASLT